MRRGKFLSLGLVAALTTTLLSGCGDYDEVSELNTLAALNSESSVQNNYNLSYADQQEMIYAQVSDRRLLDLSTLDKCSDNELQQVVNYLNQVDNQLVGSIKRTVRHELSGKIIGEDTGSIDSCFTDYLLFEFEKTPYYWQRTKTIVRGIDAESRSIIVDVTYSTLSDEGNAFEKEVKPDSKIIMGEPNYDTLASTRLMHWIAVLEEKLHRTNGDLTEYAKMYAQFIEAYGDPELIYESQSNDTLTDWIYNTGNQLTYNGLIDSEAEQTGATMVVRFVLVPNYVLGINLGITCKHMYVLDYKVDNDCTEGLEVFTDEGYATVADSVWELIYSYFTCIDENNFDGLYKLTTNFGALDKHYNDMFTTSYRKHNNFSITLFDIRGTHISCGVTIASKVRAKGSNMTFPNYTDRYYVEIELVDDALQVRNMVLLSRTIEGEPAITSDEADLSGFMAIIDLDNDDKIAIEKLICNFGALQLLGDTTSDDFGSTVDLSMSTSVLATLQTNMMSLSGKNKVVWLQNYQQGTSNYASVKCKELFQNEDGTVNEASVTYDFILKGGRWYVYGYSVNSSVRLDITSLSTTGCLCLISAGKVESYTSQVRNTASSSLDTVSDTSVTYEHKVYKPILKERVVEQGKVKITPADITSEMFNEVAQVGGYGFTYEQWDGVRDSLMGYFVESGYPAGDIDRIEEELYKCAAIHYNIIYDRYSGDELQGVWNYASTLGDFGDELRKRGSGFTDEYYASWCEMLGAMFKSMNSSWK